ncbi:hypothetical protein PGAG_00299 [Phaeocystis globosa virus 12T]|uniref:Uncharacterized protein n=1 Tax=Phaeocystis globosa virus PgV-16T TaxID=3071227 RepID=A0AC59EXK0_9VIRU|nr:hypothetical protein PGCG_00338 [Phaeocystis globosa virus]AET73188.1 hypothetical protein PGAG_00299 [Phaeocystis globosa virus 12T]AET74012.1 hypothetical protein PGBG_00304 [Phaeocystis globosa virus 14T]AGM15649.1 hypothetical protein PGCG_00338 [Phaeocystis globosa virus PgV-16T]UYE94379.1 hypothetical protein PGV14T_00338 [Phaeocystis globosa virus]
MSGASAIASARRRRAEPTATPVPPLITQQSTQKSTPASKANVTPNDNTPKQSMKPLEILQIHDSKLRTIEESMDEKIIELSKVVVHENLKFLIQEVEAIKSTNSSLRDELSSSIRNTNASVSFDSSPLEEKISTLSNNYDELKTLLIKSQQQSIDTHTEIVKMKDREVFLETRVSELESMIGDTTGNDNGGMFDMGQGGGVAEMLRSMMESSMADNSKGEMLNIHENECDDAAELYDMEEINRIENDLGELKLVEDNLDNMLDTDSQNELIDISERDEDPEEDEPNGLITNSEEVVVSLMVDESSKVAVSLDFMKTPVNLD